MKPQEKINFHDVGELTRQLTAQTIIPPRFSIEISEDEAINGLHAALAAEVAYRRLSLVLDQPTVDHLRQAARWIIDPRGKPGLLLLGTCGNGKTSLMRAIARLISYVSEVVDGYSRRIQPVMTTAKQCARMIAADAKDFDSFALAPVMFVDDMGAEPAEVISYGMVFNPMVDLIDTRYARNLLTVITTNLTSADITERYGIRTLERLRELMFIIPFTNPSYRK